MGKHRKSCRADDETLEQRTYRLIGNAWPDDLIRPTFEQSLGDPYFKYVCELVRLAQEEVLLRG